MRKTIVTSEVIVLGRQGEDGANKVLFPVRGWKELYGDGQFVVTALRPDENDPYPVTTHIYEEDDDSPVTRRGVFVEWIVGSADVEIPGRGKVELAYYTSDNVRVKSVVYHTVIYDALGQNSLTPPEPWESWVEDVREAGADAIQAAEDAEDARDDAKDYRDEAQEYASDAEGYKNDAQTAAQNAQGAVSTAFGQITATATTLSPGSSATAAFNPSTKVMHFGIPKGDTGDDGAIFWATIGTTTHAEVGGAFNSGAMVFAKDNSGCIYMLVNHYVGMHDVFKFVCPVVDNATSFLMVANLDENNQWETDTGDGGDIFWAEFGVTLYDDVRAAITAGKFVVAKYGNKVGVLVESPTSFITFVCLMSAHVYFWTLASMDTWTETEATYEKRGKITVGNTTYTPTRKALAITENGVTTTYYVADITNT